MRPQPRTCPHDIVERDIAVTADGYCPLCQAVEIKRLRSALEAQLEAHNYAEVLEIARKALAGEEQK